MKVLNAKFAILFAAIVSSFGLMACSSDGGNGAIVPEEEESSKLIPLKVTFGATSKSEDLGSRSLFKETDGEKSFFWWEKGKDKLAVIISSHNGNNDFYNVNFDALELDDYSTEGTTVNREYAKFKGEAYVSQIAHLGNGSAIVGLWYLPSYEKNMEWVTIKGSTKGYAYKSLDYPFATINLGDQTAVNNSEALGLFGHSCADKVLKASDNVFKREGDNFILNYDQTVCMKKIFSFAHFRMGDLPTGAQIDKIAVYGNGVYRTVYVKNLHSGNGQSKEMSYSRYGKDLATESSPIYVYPNIDFYMALFPGNVSLNFKVTLKDGSVYKGKLNDNVPIAEGELYRGYASGSQSIGSQIVVSLTKQK